MFYFPIFDKIAEYLRKQGTWVYWIWVLAVGFLGAISISVWRESGFAVAKPVLAITLFVWVVLAYPVYLYEKRKHKSKEGNEKKY